MSTNTFTSVIQTYIASTQPANNYKKNLNRLAKALAEKARLNNQRQLNLLATYYVYVYLDPRYPGNYSYTLPSGKQVTFKHRPFYVGKGKNSRLNKHIQEAKRSTKNTYKLNVLRKLLELGLQPEIKQTATLVTEALALAFEVDLIEGIGRKSERSGPLANLTAGGEGLVNPSAATRQKQRAHKVGKSLTVAHKQKIKDSVNSLSKSELRERQMRAWAARTPEQKAERIRKLSVSFSLKSKEEQRNINAKRVAACKKARDNWTPEERAANSLKIRLGIARSKAKKAKND